MASGLPAIPSGLPSDLRQFLSRIREFVTSDQFVSPDDLVSAGVASIDAYGRLVGTSPGTSSGDPLDMTPPPAPVNVTASGAMTNIILEWDNPHYSNLSYAEIFRAGKASPSDPDPTIGDAVHIGVSTGTLYADPVAEGSSYWYWVRFWSKADVVGPWNATAGTPGATAPNPGYLMDLLTGSDPLVPFITLAVPTEINGVMVPAGVYMKNGFMDMLVAKRGQIGALAVDDAAIENVSAAKVTFGEMSGDRIEVDSLNANRINVTNLAAKMATITQAYVGNANISGAIYSNDYVPGASGWKIDKGGAAELNTGTFRGALAAATGTFSGALSAATGTFSGSLSAASGTFTGAVNGGAFNVGSYTGYAWPAAGGTGVHISVNGMLVGNPAGKYFQIYTPPGEWWNASINTNIPAFIGDLTVTTAKIADLNVNGNKITGVTTGSVYLGAGASVWIGTPSTLGRVPMVGAPSATGSGPNFFTPAVSIVATGGGFTITNNSTQTAIYSGDYTTSYTSPAAATIGYSYL